MAGNLDQTSVGLRHTSVTTESAKEDVKRARTQVEVIATQIKDRSAGSFVAAAEEKAKRIGVLFDKIEQRLQLFSTDTTALDNALQAAQAEQQASMNK